jgi:hypothetical protein
MSTRQRLTEQALRVTLTLLLMVLTYQGRLLVQRVERLERQTTAIMVELGIPPVACDSLENGVQKPPWDSPREIKLIRKSKKKWSLPLDTADGTLVAYRVPLHDR